MIEVSDNDIEYYQRKVVRMEQDISILQEELNRVRLKLRTAEDYQIKYRILIKNNQVDLQRAKIEAAMIEEDKSKLRIAEALKHNDEHWTKVKQDLQAQLKKQGSEQIEKIEAELQVANKKLKDISQKKEQADLFSFKVRKFEKENAALEQQLADIKRVCEREKNQEWAFLRNQLNAAFREKLATERQSNQARIESLTKKLIQKQTQDNFILNMPDLSNAQLLSLKQLYSATKTSHQREIDKSQQTILRKNAQIKSLLRQQSDRQAKIQEILINKNKEVSQLEQEITRLRRQNQEQVLQLGKRMQVVKESEGYILKEQIRRLNDQIKQKETEMSRLVQSYSQSIQSHAQRTGQETGKLAEKNKKLEQIVQRSRYQLRERQQRIAQLTSQIKAQKQKNYEDGDEAGLYQNGILFLQRQLRRAEHKNQQNKQLYAKLQMDFQTFRKEAEEQIGRLNEKLKQERKLTDEKLRAAQNQIRELVQKLAAKSKQISHNKRQFVTQKLSLQVQLRALKSEVEQIDADYNRLQQIRKGLQISLKNERLKRFSLPQKQNESFRAVQADFQALYREKEEELRRKSDEKVNKMTKDIKKLNQKLRQLQYENISLKKSQQRLSSEAQKNKQNAIIKQQKQIATIELELARANNIYQALLNKINQKNESKSLLGLSRREMTQFLTPKTSK